MENTKKCKKCNKTLRAIGYNRRNGACHFDWDKRKFHKKCFKQDQEEKEIMRWIQRHRKKDLDPTMTETSSANQSPNE